MSTRVLILALAIVASITALAIDRVLSGEQVLQLLASVGGVSAGAGLLHLARKSTGDPPA